MSSALPSVRRATPADLDVVVDVLVQSHVDYVWEQWALPWPDRAQRLARVYRGDIARLALPEGEVWMTEGGESVAVWLPAGAWSGLDDADRAALEAVAQAEFGDRLALIEAVDAQISAARPASAWHLATMGTRPAHQGRGLGAAVLGPRLVALDQAGETAGLETSEIRNVAFYARLGFEVVAEVATPPHDAPHTWLMQRRP